MITGSVISLVTLFLNNTIQNDMDNYIPKEAVNDIYYFYYNTTYNEDPVPVKYDEAFLPSNFFPKCCKPGFLYEPENRNCEEAKNVLQIYEELKISVNLIRYGLVECPVLIDRFVDKNNLKRLDGDGSLLINDTTFPDGQFCVDKLQGNDDDYVIRLCQEVDYCLNRNTNNSEKDWCIYKCCPDTYALIDGQCRQSPKMGLNVKQYKNLYEKIDGYAFFNLVNVTCSASDWFDLRQVQLSIKTDGSIFRYEDSTEYKITEYCLDTRYNTQAKTYTDIISLCLLGKAPYFKWDMVRILVIFTCACYVITIAVYVFVYKMRKLMEKIITCFCVINLIFWILYALRIFFIDFGGFCAFFGYIYFFTMISRLSWLNVLSYEIWQNLGKTRVKVGETADVLWKRFMYLCMYAIAVPFSCTFIFILGNQGRDYLPETIKPYIKPVGCTIDITKYQNYGHYLFLYLPIWTLIILNLVFYVKTIQHFLKIKHELKRIKSTNQNHKEVKANQKNGFIILKLGLIMGITWIYYIYDFLNSFKNISVLEAVGVILRFSNILEGFYFLIVFVVKWKTVKEILHKLNIVKKQRQKTSADPTTSVGSVTTVSSNVSVDIVPMETLSK